MLELRRCSGHSPTLLLSLSVFVATRDEAGPIVSSEFIAAKVNLFYKPLIWSSPMISLRCWLQMIGPQSHLRGPRTVWLHAQLKTAHLTPPRTVLLLNTEQLSSLVYASLHQCNLTGKQPQYYCVRFLIYLQACANCLCIYGQNCVKIEICISPYYTTFFPPQIHNVLMHTWFFKTFVCLFFFSYHWTPLSLPTTPGVCVTLW